MKKIKHDSDSKSMVIVGNYCRQKVLSIVDKKRNRIQSASNQKKVLLNFRILQLNTFEAVQVQT